jgi:hypothetical protein
MAMTHGFDLLPGIEKGKSFKILAFSEKDYRAIPVSFYEKPISHYEKPNYEVGFSSGAPPPRQSQKPPMDDNEDSLAPQ